MWANPISSGVGSLITQRYARLNSLALANSLTRLSTGRRINRGADDPAGLIASQSMDATLAALDAETSANERAINQADTADGALSQVSDLLTEAKTLVAANANSAGLSSDEKQANQLQVDSILATVDRISSSTSFLGRKLLDGSGSIGASGKSFAISSSASATIGKTTDESTSTTYTLADLRSGKSLNIADGSSATAGDVIDQAIHDVSRLRGGLGAFETNTLQTRLTGIAISREQLTATVSLIRDTDYAAEVSQNVRLQLLQSASINLMRIGNHRRGSILSILA